MKLCDNFKRLLEHLDRASLINLLENALAQNESGLAVIDYSIANYTNKTEYKASQVAKARNKLSTLVLEWEQEKRILSHLRLIRSQLEKPNNEESQPNVKSQHIYDSTSTSTTNDIDKALDHEKPDAECIACGSIINEDLIGASSNLNAGQNEATIYNVNTSPTNGCELSGPHQTPEIESARLNADEELSIFSNTAIEHNISKTKCVTLSSGPLADSIGRPPAYRTASQLVDAVSLTKTSTVASPSRVRAKVSLSERSSPKSGKKDLHRSEPRSRKQNLPKKIVSTKSNIGDLRLHSSVKADQAVQDKVADLTSSNSDLVKPWSTDEKLKLPCKVFVQRLSDKQIGDVSPRSADSLSDLSDDENLDRYLQINWSTKSKSKSLAGKNSSQCIQVNDDDDNATNGECNEDDESCSESSTESPLECTSNALQKAAVPSDMVGSDEQEDSWVDYSSEDEARSKSATNSLRTSKQATDGSPLASKSNSEIDHSDVEHKNKSLSQTLSSAQALLDPHLLDSSDSEDTSSDNSTADDNPPERTEKKKSLVDSVSKSNKEQSTAQSAQSKKQKGSKITKLRVSSSSDDSDDDFQPKAVKRKIAKKPTRSGTLGRSICSSDEEDEAGKELSGSNGSETESDSSAGASKASKKPKKRRIAVADDSSDDSVTVLSMTPANDENSQAANKRRHIRDIMSHDKLQAETRQAQQEERDRRRRLRERQQLFNKSVMESSTEVWRPPENLVLARGEHDSVLVEVDRSLVAALMRHQVEAVQFIWDCIIERLPGQTDAPSTPNSNVKRQRQPQTLRNPGCILAHCMGLGKTLSTIVFIHTLLMHSDLVSIKKVLVIVPKNTLLNWVDEFRKWVPKERDLDVYTIGELSRIADRLAVVENWFHNGGILLISYTLMQTLSQYRPKKQATTSQTQRVADAAERFFHLLIDPGPDLLVCDEGHLLKNPDSQTCKTLAKVATRRRLVLTGTPLQNNLVEYYTMVNFVKENLLGTRKEFMNQFGNPIKQGQHKDSSYQDVVKMKRRAHVLHETLAGCVQRFDYAILTSSLPPKFEYVLYVRLTQLQVQLHEKYLELLGFSEAPEQSWSVDSAPAAGNGLAGSGADAGDARLANSESSLFRDFRTVQYMCNHPLVLLLRDEACSSGARDSDDSWLESDDSDAGGRRLPKKKSSKQPEDDRFLFWYRSIFAASGLPVKGHKVASALQHDLARVASHSAKFLLLGQILTMCEDIGDKLLLFSSSIKTLNLIEDYLKAAQEEREAQAEALMDIEDESSSTGTNGANSGNNADEAAKESVLNPEWRWRRGVDYVRMDGTTSADERTALMKRFNNPDNPRCRLFLISTRAGNLGTNLIGANRVILFDVSWNPSHDKQAIFRAYRYGQSKPVYIYRFVSQGTMEERIYDRQVTKLSVSLRVVDEQQIARHFSCTDLSELYSFHPKASVEDVLESGTANADFEQFVPPKDRLLIELIRSRSHYLTSYHEHDSLLDHKQEEELTEEERKLAWEDIEAERRRSVSYPETMAQMQLRWKPMEPRLHSLVTALTAALASAPPNASAASRQALIQRVLNTDPTLELELVRLILDVANVVSFLTRTDQCNVFKLVLQWMTIRVLPALRFENASLELAAQAFFQNVMRQRLFEQFSMHLLSPNTAASARQLSTAVPAGVFPSTSNAVVIGVGTPSSGASASALPTPPLIRKHPRPPTSLQRTNPIVAPMPPYTVASPAAPPPSTASSLCTPSPSSLTASVVHARLPGLTAPRSRFSQPSQQSAGTAQVAPALPPLTRPNTEGANSRLPSLQGPMPLQPPQLPQLSQMAVSQPPAAAARPLPGRTMAIQTNAPLREQLRALAGRAEATAPSRGTQGQAQSVAQPPSNAPSASAVSANGAAASGASANTYPPYQSTRQSVAQPAAAAAPAADQVSSQRAADATNSVGGQATATDSAADS